LVFTQTLGGRNHIEIITFNQELSRALGRALSRAKEQNTTSSQGDLFDKSATQRRRLFLADSKNLLVLNALWLDFLPTFPLLQISIVT